MKLRLRILAGTLGAGALLVTMSVPVPAAGLFQPAVNYGVGQTPFSVTVGDFNADAKPDLAVANSSSPNVSILLGNGDGTFQAAVNYGTGGGPRSVAMGDFNGDAKPDLATANYASDNVSVLLGNGNGTFQAAVSYAAGTNAYSVAAGDLNGDAKPDLAVANQGSNNVSILLGNGDGTFQAAVSYGAGTNPESVGVADFNGDAKPDLAVANISFNNVYILLGNGDGTFQTAVGYGVGAPQQSLTVGDLNSDGKPDLALANYNSANVSILLGNGDGTFQAPVNYAAAANAFSVGVGDFNGDGKRDLAVANVSSANVSILLGNGNGTFQTADNYGAGTGPSAVAVGDFNGDAKPDLAVANQTSNNVSILLGTAAAGAPTGLLRVVSSPPVPTQILVDGQIADSWGLAWLKIAPGSHTLCFTHVEGWSDPSCLTVSVVAHSTTTVTAAFFQRGSLRVITSPAVPSQISVDGLPRNDWGMWTDIPAGAHQVCFGAVAGFNPPSCQNISVVAGSLTTLNGVFATNPSAVGQSGVGLLRAVTSPAVPAQITIKPSAGSPYVADTWGLNWLELPPGSYTVSFSHVPGYTEPASQTVMVTAGNTTTVTGNFTQRGFLRVMTSPAVAGTILVDGIPRNDWGMWTDIPTGSHTVCFGAADGYAKTPACQTVTVNAGLETDATGTYS